MSDVAVVTANFGGYDVPRGAVAQEGYEDVDWYYVTSEGDPGPPWWLLHFALDGDSDVPSRLLAKRFKLTPWDYLDHDYRWIVWLDANMEVTSPRFLWEALAGAACSGAPLTAWRHPRRSHVSEEAAASLTEAPAKYGTMADRLQQQVAQYMVEGFPDDLGLFACGTLVWNMAERSADGEGWRQPARTLGAAWLAECEQHTIQDQVSLPVVAWRLGMDVATFPVDQVPRFQTKPRSAPYIQNEWLRIWPHNRED